MITKARPTTLSMGMNPRLLRESLELVRLSPITNRSPLGTVQLWPGQQLTSAIGLKYGSGPRALPFTYTVPLWISTVSPGRPIPRFMKYFSGLVVGPSHTVTERRIPEDGEGCTASGMEPL